MSIKLVKSNIIEFRRHKKKHLAKGALPMDSEAGPFVTGPPLIALFAVTFPVRCRISVPHTEELTLLASLLVALGPSCKV